MGLEQWGAFTLEESTITTVEASIYEARSGSAEGSLSAMTFASGKTIKVKPTFSIALDRMDIVRQEADGGIILKATGGGTFAFCDEGSQLLFEGQWKADEDQVAITVRDHIIAELTVPATLTGVGRNIFEGHTISGTLVVRQAGTDAAGLGVFKVSGKGSLV